MLGTDGTPNRDGVRLGRIIRDRAGPEHDPAGAGRAGRRLPGVHLHAGGGGLPHPGLENLLRVAKAIDQTRLAELLEEVVATRAARRRSPSVEEVATAEAVSRFLREMRA